MPILTHLYAVPFCCRQEGASVGKDQHDDSLRRFAAARDQQSVACRDRAGCRCEFRHDLQHSCAGTTCRFVVTDGSRPGRGGATPAPPKTIGSSLLGRTQPLRACPPCLDLTSRPPDAGSKAALSMIRICPVWRPRNTFRTSGPSSSRRPQYRAAARRRRRRQECLPCDPDSAARTSTVGASNRKGPARRG